jgi:hypothetical protein
MRRARYVVLIALLVVLAVVALAYPIYVIRPFRSQGSLELQAALIVIRYRMVTGILCLGLSLWAARALWHGARVAARAGIAASVLTIGACVALARVNVYEIMFHPVGTPTYGGVSSSSLTSADKVLTVEIAGNARAYPVRILAYHHMVNDSLGGVPIIPTY